MRNLLALIGLAVVLFFGLGWYFGWYSFTVQTGSDGKLKISGDVDTNKIADDAKLAGQRIGQIANETQTPATTPTTEAKKPVDNAILPSSTGPTDVKVGPFKFSLDPSSVGRE